MQEDKNAGCGKVLSIVLNASVPYCTSASWCAPLGMSYSTSMASWDPVSGSLGQLDCSNFLDFRGSTGSKDSEGRYALRLVSGTAWMSPRHGIVHTP